MPTRLTATAAAYLHVLYIASVQNCRPNLLRIHDVRLKTDAPLIVKSTAIPVGGSLNAPLQRLVAHGLHTY